MQDGKDTDYRNRESFDFCMPNFIKGNEVANFQNVPAAKLRGDSVNTWSNDTPAASNRYHYIPLRSLTSQIRLLSLPPVNDNYPLHCSLQNCDLSTAPIYRCLSYEWGEAQPQVEILIDRQNFWIRHNLWLFLSTLRAQRKQRGIRNDLHLRLWVDALCINQKDIAERNAQVSLMGTIYQQAYSVYAWLGWAKGWEPRITFKYITSDACAYDAKNVCKPHDADENKFMGVSRLKLHEMVREMCRCRYWTRRWIVQELVLAKDVTIVCSQEELPWKAFSLFIQNYGHHFQNWTKIYPFKLSEYIQARANNPTKLPALTELLVEFSGTACEVIHDKVYSLLGLAEDGNAIQVDYGCLSQNLLCRVLMHSPWSEQTDIERLADDLGLTEWLYSKVAIIDRVQSTPSMSSLVHEKLVATHRVEDTSLPSNYLRNPLLSSILFKRRKNYVKDASDSYFGYTECTGRIQAVDLDIGSSEDLGESDESSVNTTTSPPKRKRRQRITTASHGDFSQTRILVCDNGATGTICKNARPGDMLCDFIGYKKLVIRTGNQQRTIAIIGIAVLDSRSLVDLCFELEKNLERAQFRQAFNENLGLIVSSEISSVADVLLGLEQKTAEFHAAPLQRLKGRLILKRPFLRREIAGDLRIWDLIILANKNSYP